MFTVTVCAAAIVIWNKFDLWGGWFVGFAVAAIPVVMIRRSDKQMEAAKSEIDATAEEIIRLKVRIEADRGCLSDAHAKANSEMEETRGRVVSTELALEGERRKLQSLVDRLSKVSGDGV